MRAKSGIPAIESTKVYGASSFVREKFLSRANDETTLRMPPQKNFLGIFFDIFVVCFLVFFGGVFSCFWVFFFCLSRVSAKVFLVFFFQRRHEKAGNSRSARNHANGQATALVMSNFRVVSLSAFVAPILQ